MPTAIRTKREKLRDICKAMDDAFHANLEARAPEHIKKRLNQPKSEFAKKLSLNLSLEGTADNGVGRIYDKQTGQLTKRENPDEHGANYHRRHEMLDDIVLYREQFESIWGKRGMAKVIADKTGLHVRTFQKYFKLTRIKTHG